MQSPLTAPSASAMPEFVDQWRAGLQRIEAEIGLGYAVAEQVLAALMRATGCSLEAAVETVLAACQPARDEEPQAASGRHAA